MGLQGVREKKGKREVVKQKPPGLGSGGFLLVRAVRPHYRTVGNRLSRRGGSGNRLFQNGAHVYPSGKWDKPPRQEKLPNGWPIHAVIRRVFGGVFQVRFQRTPEGVTRTTPI